MKVLFFAPHAATWEHSFPEALVASALQEKGHEIVYVTCDEIFNSYCMAMAATGIRFDRSSPENRARICRLCNMNKNLIRDCFGFQGYDIGTVLTETDRREVQEEISKVNRENYLSQFRADIPVGRVALYEVILQNKKRNLDFNDEQWRHYLTTLENTLLSLRAAERIFDRERPDAVAIYSSAYPVNHVWKLLAARRRIRAYFTQGGPNLAEIWSHLYLAYDPPEKNTYFGEVAENWRDYQNAPSTESSIRSVVRHFETLFRRTGFVHSAPRKGQNVREYFSIPQGAKLLTATLSSFDESFGMEAIGYTQFPDAPIFRSQVEWVERLIQFCSERKDLFLLIRVHPREFPKKGASPVLSENAKALQEKFKNLPPNVRVNWPTDELSMYDVADETDVILNGFSSVGSEMPALGIPVVAYMALADWIPADLNYVATDEADYFRKIDQAISDGWQPELIRKGFRWFSLQFYWAALDLSENFRIQKKSGKSPIRRLISDPRWFAESVKERLLRSINPEAVPVSLQKHLLRGAKVSSELTEEIHQLFSSELRSVLSLRKERALSGDRQQEDIWLKRGVGSIAAAMARSGRSESPLVRNLKGFAAGETL